MKKILYYINLFIILLIIFPCLTNAATELGTSTQSPIVGSDIYIQVDANYGTKFQIRDFHIIVTYNPEYLQYQSVINIQKGANVIDENGIIYIDKEPGQDWDCGALIQLKFTVLRDGPSKVDIKGNGESHYNSNCDKGCDVIGQSFAPVTISAKKPSSNTTIGTLYVKGYTIQPTFQKSTYNYNLTVPAEVTSIDIIGTKGNNRQTIKGLGIAELNYGINQIPIVVSAEDGSSSTYMITVTREDNRTGDTTLKSLSVTNTNIKYVENQDAYEATVGKNTESVLITAHPTDSNAQLTGTGTQKLEFGLNTFTLTVTSSKGQSKKYTINITRSTKDLNTSNPSSKLTSIKVNGLGLDMSNAKDKWLIGISNNDTKLNIETTKESETATVEIIGNENLVAGINVINLKVKEMNEEETEYTLIVYKNIASQISDINNIPTNNNISFNTINTNITSIPSNTLATIKDNNLKLYYNVVNIYNGILYQAIISNNLPNNDLNPSFNKIDENQNIIYETNLPAGTEMLLYLDDKYLDDVSVKIYTYDETNKLTLLTDGVKVKNGYISFITNGQKNYIITTKSLISSESPITEFINKNKTIFIICILGIIVIIYVINSINKKNKQKEKNEPLY